MPEKESQMVKWIKELEGRRGKLDLQMDELDQQIAEITWRITQLGEFKREIEEGVISVAHPQIIAEKTELEIKNLARLKGERTEHKGEIAVDGEFCHSLLSYLGSKLESSQGKPSFY